MATMMKCAIVLEQTLIVFEPKKIHKKHHEDTFKIIHWKMSAVLLSIYTTGKQELS